MRKLFVVLLLLSLALLALPAQASPARDPWLPDADLFCGADMVDVGLWIGNPQAGTLWIDGGSYAGHYVFITSSHYLDFLDEEGEELGTAPVTDFTDLIFAGARSYGRKQGLTDRVSCQVVSRFEGMLTVYAPLELAKVR
jgi:hypothetical protein